MPENKIGGDLLGRGAASHFSHCPGAIARQVRPEAAFCARADPLESKLSVARPHTKMPHHLVRHLLAIA